MKKAVLILLIASGFWLVSGAPAWSQSYDFSVMAGIPYAQGFADGTNGGAQFSSPEGIAMDSAGNLYVADSLNYVIRKVAPDATGTNWIVTTIAGMPGSFGSADGTNSAARFNLPNGIAADAAGNLYVADSFNSTIRKVAPDATGTNWIVTTLAGLAMNPGTNNGTNSAARFYVPTGIAVDTNTNVYVGDRVNGTIRRLAAIDATGTNWAVTTLAGMPGNPGTQNGTNENAQFNYPYGVALDAAGDIYVADSANDLVRKVTLKGTNWVVTTLAGSAGNAGDADGTGTNAMFYDPVWLVVDAAGNVFVSDLGNDALREVTPAGEVSTLKLAMNVQFAGGLAGLAVDTNEDLYVADSSTMRKGVPLIVFSLQIQSVNDQVVLSWPAAATNYFLQSASVLAPNGNWAPVTNALPVIVGNSFVLTNNVSDGNVYYRLKSPVP